MMYETRWMRNRHVFLFACWLGLLSFPDTAVSAQADEDIKHVNPLSWRSNRFPEDHGTQYAL
jgi:hypothetical protein